MKISMKVFMLTMMMTLVVLLVFSKLDLRVEKSATREAKEYYEYGDSGHGRSRASNRAVKRRLRTESSTKQLPSRKESKLYQAASVEQRQTSQKEPSTSPSSLEHKPVVPTSAPKPSPTITRETETPKPPTSEGPIKGNYPEWFSTAWANSNTYKHRDEIVNDKPLFPECPKMHSSNSDKYHFIEPKNYLPSFKNPCWYEDQKREQGFRCIPYFYIAGVAKCGTTDLYKRLRMHPDIMQGTKKEYHFWDRERFGNVETTEAGEVLKVHRKPWTFKEYTDVITGDELRVVQKEAQSETKSDKIFGDGSPSYLWDILNWQLLEGNQGCKEPRVVIGQHIRHIYPPSKMILIFRHPTPRLYSRFLSRIWRTSFLKGATSQTFHDYVEKGVKMYQECFKRWSIRTCAYNYTLFDSVVVRLVEGMYPIFMADWLRIWPRNQMLFLRNEDYGRNLTETLEKAFNFLDVAGLTGSDYDQVMNQRLVNVGSEYDKIGPMKQETINILDKFYQPFVEQFAELLQDRRFLWQDTYTPSL